MNTSVANTWPIATRRFGEFLLIGVPQRLGDGAIPTSQSYFTFPSLEEVAGDDWQTKVLEILLPKSQAWAWWAPSECKGLNQLVPASAPEQVCLDALTDAVAKRWLLRGKKLVLIPSGHIAAQAITLEWAGMDTEQQPEFLFAFSPANKVCNTSQLGEWCLDRTRWSDPKSLASLGMDRVIIIFDGTLYSAARHDPDSNDIQGLKLLADQWGLELIAAPSSAAWPG